jgi:hypothetical protein
MPRPGFIPAFTLQPPTLTGTGDYMGAAASLALSAFALSQAPVTIEQKDRHA